jgi:predicted ATPase/DNA-binding SARP family transcriptional activator
MLEVRLIGKFEIQSDGQPVILASRAGQSLFAYLILTAGTVHRREKLAGMLWPDESEGKARSYLRNELWRIRKVLPQNTNIQYLLADNLTVGFNPAADYWLDAVGLKDLSDNPSTDELIQVLSHYQGDLLPGFYEDWVVLEREHLLVHFEQKIACLLEVLEKEQRWQEILEWAEHWISFGQAPEVAYRALMVAYDAQGDHAKVAATYERCKQALSQLALEPSEETRTLAFKRSSKIKVPVPLTSFIGREKELKELAGLFSKSRLITLTGSGGVGKTRLAIQVVAEVMDLFPDGVWFLDLAPLSDPSMVPNALSNLLELRAAGAISITDLLISFFRSRKALVIFDNCEHLIDACAQLVNSLLTSCKDLAVLATSRETLRVSGEIPYRVPSLEIPKPGIDFTVEQFSRIESVKLFIQRATFASLGFTVNSQNVAAISRICQRLDGIPLAIELAAARVNTLTVEQLANHLDDHLNLLTHGLRSLLPRQQTLWAMIEWSYDLLSEKERILFRRLAVFLGGWTLEAAQEVCSGDRIERDDVLDLLSQLVNKSLVLADTSAGEAHYSWLETIRQFAREKLFETAEVAQIQEKYLEYFLNFAEITEMHFPAGMAFSHAWLELYQKRLGMDKATIQSSVEQGLNEFQKLGDSGAESIILLWLAYLFIDAGAGTREERLETMLRAVARAHDSGYRLQIANSLVGMAEVSMVHGQWEEAERILLEAERFYTTMDSPQLFNGLPFLRARIFLMGRDLAKAKANAKLAIEYSNQIGERLLKCQTISVMALIAEAENDFQSALLFAQQGLELAKEMRIPQEIAWNSLLVGIFNDRLGKIGDALQYVRNSLEYVHRGPVGDNMIINIFVQLAGLLIEKKPRVAVQILAFTEALQRSSEIYNVNVLVKPYYDRFLSSARAKLSKAQFTLACEAGYQMSLAETIAYALKELQ